jgi:hypothetical protein
MFRQLAAAIGVQRVLTEYRPSQLSEFLETYWQSPRLGIRQVAFGPDVTPASHQQMGRPAIIDPLPPALPDPPPPHSPLSRLSTGVTWHHLVYAYMLENTRIVDIFRRVIYEWTTGERLPTIRERTQHWLHTTEQLFFGSPWSYSVRSVTSSIRPDSGATRRNAYYRLLGMDLNHGTDDGHVYPYPKPEIANRDFANVFEALLIEVWRGYANRTTLVAENLTDDAAITTLVRRLREMLRARRNAGTLSREEFDAVAMLSWFHLTVETNTDVVLDLNATAQGTADRLIKIGERVGLPAHARSDAYFQLAVPMSNVLLAIEANAITAAPQLYSGFYMNDMLDIITHWSVATGRNIKDKGVRVPISTVLRQLVPTPATTVNVEVSTPAPSGNGAAGRMGAYVR